MTACHCRLLCGALILFIASCGPADSASEPNLQAVSGGPGNELGTATAVATRRPPAPDLPPPTPEEKAAMERLEQLGAKIDLDLHGHVRTVELLDIKLSDDALQVLQQLPAVESLDVSGCTVTDEQLAQLGNLKSLERLYLDGLPITDAGLAHLAKLPRLEVLTLAETDVKGPGLASLQTLRNLEVLSLARTPVTDAALKHLASFPELHTLRLDGTKITGDGLKLLQPLKAKLRTLNISQTTVKDPDLFNLVGLTNLRMLFIEDCDLTEENIEKFEEQMVSLAVF